MLLALLPCQARVMATIGVTRGLGDHDLKVYSSNIHIKPFLCCYPEVSRAGWLCVPRVSWAAGLGWVTCEHPKPVAPSSSHGEPRAVAGQGGPGVSQPLCCLGWRPGCHRLWLLEPRCLVQLPGARSTASREADGAFPG